MRERKIQISDLCFMRRNSQPIELLFQNYSIHILNTDITSDIDVPSRRWWDIHATQSWKSVHYFLDGKLLEVIIW
jgi:hypothetical protein